MLEIPGLYVRFDSPNRNTKTDGVRGEAVGRLASSATEQHLSCWFSGILTHDRLEGGDAETALGAYRNDGIEGLKTLEGFYNLCLVDRRADTIYLLSDPLCSRPLYLYQSSRAEQGAAATTPLAFARWGLPMRLSATGLYEMFRFQHTCVDRTLVSEVMRAQPGRLYQLTGEGEWKSQQIHSFDRDENPSIDVADAAAWIKSQAASVVEGTLTHPRLHDLPLEHPLTAGMDSRHLLGELMAQGRPPEQIRHIYIKRKEYEPVRQIASGENIPLQTTPIAELDTPGLTRQWMARSGGLLNFHQYYLLHFGKHDRAATVGFEGYLMDDFWGLAPRISLDVPPEDVAKPVWNDIYTRPNMLRILFEDAKALGNASRSALTRKANEVKGPPWYRALFLNFRKRGMHYTGVFPPMLPDDAFYFAPGAHPRTREFIRKVPWAAAGGRRARLYALQQHFPTLAGYPGPDGKSYANRETYSKGTSSLPKKVAAILKAIGTGFQTDPAPESEHAWLRQIEPLQAIHRRAVFDSSLVRDGHLRSHGVKGAWYLLRAGGFQAWPLMSLLTAETAYRLLVKQQSLSDVSDWLWDEAPTRVSP